MSAGRAVAARDWLQGNAAVLLLGLALLAAAAVLLSYSSGLTYFQVDRKAQATDSRSPRPAGHRST